MCESEPPHGQDLSLQRILAGAIDEADLSYHAWKVMQQLIACGTGDLGYHYLVCDHCGHLDVVGRACKNRHCPNCNLARAAEWLEQRENELLPVPYQRYEFGLPSGLKRYALRYKREIYRLLMKAAQDTVLESAKDPASLGVAPAVMTSMHTATQALNYYPHAHVEASAGGYDAEQDQWIPAKEGALIAPLDQAHDLFRDKILEGLDLCRRHGRFSDGDRPDRPEIELLDDDLWTNWLAHLREQRWPVSGGEPFGGGLQNLRYLGKTTYRVPITNRQLLSYRDGEVVFQYRDRKTGQNKTRRMTAVSFVKLLATHILPPYFHKNRFAGLWAVASRPKLEAARTAARRVVGSFLQDPPTLSRWIPPEHRCKHCRCGEMNLVLTIAPWAFVWGPAAMEHHEARGSPWLSLDADITRTV